MDAGVGVGFRAGGMAIDIPVSRTEESVSYTLVSIWLSMLTFTQGIVMCTFTNVRVSRPSYQVYLNDIMV